MVDGAPISFQKIVDIFFDKAKIKFSLQINYQIDDIKNKVNAPLNGFMAPTEKNTVMDKVSKEAKKLVEDQIISINAGHKIIDDINNQIWELLRSRVINQLEGTFFDLYANWKSNFVTKDEKHRVETGLQIIRPKYNEIYNSFYANMRAVDAVRPKYEKDNAAAKTLLLYALASYIHIFIH